MTFDPHTAMVIYRSKLHTTLKRNYQLMPALKWLRVLLNHVPDEHLVRYYGYYSNCSRGARRRAEHSAEDHIATVIDDTSPDWRRKANWARLIQKVYEVDPLECPNCGDAMRIIALIDDNAVIESILKHLGAWTPRTNTAEHSGTDPPSRDGETVPLTYHPVPDIA